MTVSRTWPGLAALLALAAALKLARYSDPPPSLELRTQQAIAALLANDGWTQVGWQNLVTDGSVRAELFSRADCGAPLAVAVLARGEEVASLAIQDLGPTAALLPASGDIPMLVVARPPSQFGHCPVPEAAAWRSLDVTAADATWSGWLRIRLAAIFQRSTP